MSIVQIQLHDKYKIKHGILTLSESGDLLVFQLSCMTSEKTNLKAKSLWIS